MIKAFNLKQSKIQSLQPVKDPGDVWRFFQLVTMVHLAIGQIILPGIGDISVTSL
jgi:hypothetical protein